MVEIELVEDEGEGVNEAESQSPPPPPTQQQQQPPASAAAAKEAQKATPTPHVATLHPACFPVPSTTESDATTARFPPRKYDPESNHPACVEQPPRDAKAASNAKQRGNDLFAARKFAEAAEAYAEALDLVPLVPEHEYARAVFHSNRAACFVELSKFREAVDDCTRAVALDPRYLKAYVRRAKAHEALEELDDALADVNEALKIDPTQRPLLAERTRLEKAVQDRNEKLKDEMLGKLKDLGNSILGKFGMSLNNFQMVQDPNTGSYSISYKNS